MKRHLRRLKRFLVNTLDRPMIFKLNNIGKESFTCPLCNYYGPLKDYRDKIFFIRHHDCPKCKASYRHRLQYLVLNQLSEVFDYSEMSILHCAPEPALRKHLSRLFKEYMTIDLLMNNVNYRANLRNLPFKDETFDVVFASHVLEHIKEDDEAISEIRRIIKPNGFAVLPVPIVGYETIEYPEPNSCEHMHVRSCGADYFEKYRKYFSKVEIYQSSDFPFKYQTYIYEDRSNWPDTMPLRPVMDGDKHEDHVPICYV